MRSTFTSMLLFFTAFLFAQNTDHFTVYFASDSYKISTSDYSKIADFIALQDPAHILSIEVEGHTDNAANEAYNEQLSAKRCNTITTFLVNKLNISVPIKTQAKGENAPVASNETEAGRQQNRRVVITVFTEIEDVIAVEPPPFYPTNETYFYDNWKKEEQTYTINPAQSNILKGKEGTIIILPPNAICGAEDYFSVQIHLEEYYNRGDMLLARLTTSSNNQMLETAGMVNLTATHKGEPLTLCKKATVLFPKKQNSNDTIGFQGFEGNWENPHGNIDWDASSPPFSAFSGADYLGGERDLPNYVTIRCGLRCDNWVFGNSGSWSYKKNLRKDEVKQRLRKRFWFKTSVPTALYAETYEGIKDKMKDTMSASLYYPIWISRMNTQRIRQNLDSLSNGGEIDPYFLEQTSNYLITQVSSFGPINCDRFTSYDNKKDFTFQIGESEGTVSSRLVFNNINSILPGTKEGKRVKFKNIPVGETVTIIVIKYLKGQIQLATEKFQLGKEPSLRFQTIEKSKLEETIRSVVGSID